MEIPLDTRKTVWVLFSYTFTTVTNISFGCSLNNNFSKERKNTRLQIIKEKTRKTTEKTKKIRIWYSFLLLLVFPFSSLMSRMARSSYSVFVYRRKTLKPHNSSPPVHCCQDNPLKRILYSQSKFDTGTVELKQLRNIETISINLMTSFSYVLIQKYMWWQYCFALGRWQTAVFIFTFGSQQACHAGYEWVTRVFLRSMNFALDTKCVCVCMSYMYVSSYQVCV